MKALGVGAGATALGGTAAGDPERGNRIDKVHGATYAAEVHNVPSGLVDRITKLNIHGGDATHERFPTPDGGDEDD